tara:strand:+ start:320 stop:460 length:141 start_codon:yes stop_codon:yes gene_type:complete
MVKKTYNLEKKNPKHNQEWSWDETPEVKEALERLHQNMRDIKKDEK